MKYVSFVASVQAALRGIGYAHSHEKNFRREIWCGVFAIGTLFLLQGERIDYIIVMLLIFAVLVAELTNTALERAVDIMKPHKHPYARVIKDLSAALVFMSAIAAFCVGVLIYVPLTVAFFV